MPLNTTDTAAPAALQRFTVTAQDGEATITLEVDTAKLTVELATEINNFWGDMDGRLQAEDGDVIRAVIRMYGARVMAQMFAAGGCSCDERIDPAGPRFWTTEMQAEEGWPGADDSQHGALGIRVVEAFVEVPGFYDVNLLDA